MAITCSFSTASSTTLRKMTRWSLIILAAWASASWGEMAPVVQTSKFRTATAISRADIQKQQESGLTLIGFLLGCSDTFHLSARISPRKGRIWINYNPFSYFSLLVPSTHQAKPITLPKIWQSVCSLSLEKDVLKNALIGILHL